MSYVLCLFFRRVPLSLTKDLLRPYVASERCALGPFSYHFPTSVSMLLIHTPFSNFVSSRIHHQPTHHMSIPKAKESASKHIVAYFGSHSKPCLMHDFTRSNDLQPGSTNISCMLHARDGPQMWIATPVLYSRQTGKWDKSCFGWGPVGQWWDGSVDLEECVHQWLVAYGVRGSWLSGNAFMW